MGTMPTMTVTLPWPADALQPNARVHWAAKAAAVKRARSDAWLCANAIKRQVGWIKCKAATIRATFYAPQKRKRDGDNHLAACKAYFDGLADAGVIENDAGFAYDRVVFLKDADKRVELLIQATE